MSNNSATYSSEKKNTSKISGSNITNINSQTDTHTHIGAIQHRNVLYKFYFVALRGSPMSGGLDKKAKNLHILLLLRWIKTENAQKLQKLPILILIRDIRDILTHTQSHGE